MSDSPFMLNLEVVRILEMQHKNKVVFAPDLFSTIQYLSCHREKQQLVTPYGRDRWGHFEHLPAWTTPYVLEFVCLLSAINENVFFFSSFC